MRLELFPHRWRGRRARRRLRRHQLQHRQQQQQSSCRHLSEAHWERKISSFSAREVTHGSGGRLGPALTAGTVFLNLQGFFSCARGAVQGGRLHKVRHLQCRHKISVRSGCLTVVHMLDVSSAPGKGFVAGMSTQDFLVRGHANFPHPPHAQKASRSGSAASWWGGRSCRAVLAFQSAFPRCSFVWVFLLRGFGFAAGNRGSESAVAARLRPAAAFLHVGCPPATLARALLLRDAGAALFCSDQSIVHHCWLPPQLSSHQRRCCSSSDRKSVV